MSVTDLTQLLTALAIVLGAGIFAGAMRSSMRQLQEIVGDHETRIRLQEQKHG